MQVYKLKVFMMLLASAALTTPPTLSGQYGSGACTRFEVCMTDASCDYNDDLRACDSTYADDIARCGTTRFPPGRGYPGRGFTCLGGAKIVWNLCKGDARTDYCRAKWGCCSNTTLGEPCLPYDRKCPPGCSRN